MTRRAAPPAPELFPSPDPAELLALLTLRFTPQLGPRRTEALRRHFGTARAALGASLAERRAVPGLDARSLAAIGTPKPAEQAQAELEKAAGAGVRVLGRGLAGYPEALDALGDPPAVLWVRGEWPEFPAVPRALGVVGTRAVSPSARSLTRQISADLARAGVLVVSGLARGVDTEAHSAAVEAGGPSVAVLGSAVDHIYPSENVPLSRQLTLVSEYPLGTPPAQHHFPTRNRLIAALSAGSLIVEGELKSYPLLMSPGPAPAPTPRPAPPSRAAPASPPRRAAPGSQPAQSRPAPPRP